MSEPLRVYISGPISGLPIEGARLAFKMAADGLAAQGRVPVNPCDLAAPEGCRCPGATGQAGSGSGHEWSCYMRKDIAALTTCDAILMLPGWEKSHGARRELDVATTIGLDVWLPLDPVGAGQVQHRACVVRDILAELDRAVRKFPDDLQRSQGALSPEAIRVLPDGTGGLYARQEADAARRACDLAAGAAELTWRHVVAEEWAEACAETEWPKLRAELIQVGAMLTRWILDGDAGEEADRAAG